MKNTQMPAKQTAEPRQYRLALGALGLFILALCAIRLLDSIALPSASPWNLVWLGFELLLGAGAAVTALLCLFRAERRKTPSWECFREAFAQWKKPIFLVALVWCVWSFVACFLSVAEGRASLSGNVRYLYYMAVSLIVIFPLGYHLGRGRRMELLHAAFDLCYAVFLLYVLYVYYRFLRGDFFFTTLGGNEFNYYIPRIRFGLNQNNTAAYSAFFLLGGFYRFRALRSGWKKALLVLSEVVFFTVFAYSESRASIIAMAVAMGAMGGGAVYQRRKKGGVATVLLSLLCAAAAAALTVGLIYGALHVLHVLQAAILRAGTLPAAAAAESAASAAGNTAEGAAGDAAESAAANNLEARGLTGGNAATLGERKTVWLAVIRDILRDRHLLVHGCSQASVSGEVFALVGQRYNTHNQLLEVLLAYGLPALALFCVWLVWLAGKSLSLGLNRSEAGDPGWMLPPILLLLIVNNMAETMLVARIHFVGFLFFLLAGYTGGLAEAKKELRNS